MEPILVVHAAATWLMVGLSWTVRGVHYPLFALVGDFAPYHRAHLRRVTAVLAVPWLVEATTTVALPFLVVGPARTLAWAGLALQGVVAGLTGLVAVPLHDRLGFSFDPATHRRLLAVDTARAVAWTGRGVVAAALLLVA